MSDRFWGKAKKGDGCWEWTAGRFPSGYGAFWRAGKQRYAHREAYELAHGPIPDGLHVLHACDNPPCVNPEHLRAGTAHDNAMDAKSRFRHRHGERHDKAKLTHADAVAIRERWVQGEKPKALAVEFGVTAGAVSGIISGRNWRSAPYVAA